MKKQVFALLLSGVISVSAQQPVDYVNPFIGSDKNNLYLLVRENDLAGHYLNIKCTYPAIRKMLPGLLTTGNDWILLTIKIKE